MEVVVLCLLAILGIPIFGLKLIIEQPENRLLGVAVLIVGLIVWGLIGL